MRGNISLGAVWVLAVAVAILGLAAGPANAADKYWSGAGTWDTTTASWGLASGGPYDQLWVSGDNAIFEGTPGTVTLDTNIDLAGMTFNTSNYTISGQTLDFAGGSIDMAIKNGKATITSAITGSPAVNVINGSSYDGFTFVPTSGTVTLGTATIPYEDTVQTGDKAGLTLDGTTTGNSVSAVTYGAGGYPPNHYGTLRKNGSGEWSVGNVNIGTVEVNAGTLTANGTFTTKYGHLQLRGGVLDINNAGVFGAPGNSLAIRAYGGSLDNITGSPIVLDPVLDYNPAQTWYSGGFPFVGSNGANSDMDLGSGNVTLGGNATVTIQNAATTLTVDGVISHGTTPYGLTKAGDGTLALGGANTYKGNTTVSAGTLSIGEAYLDDDAVVSVGTGATLEL